MIGVVIGYVDENETGSIYWQINSQKYETPYIVDIVVPVRRCESDRGECAE